MVQTKNKYTAADIQVLEGLEAVRRRPSMYIGSTDERGLHHLVYEIVDNSIDEAMAGFCDRINISIHKDGSVTVVDNGRGIPVDKHARTGKSALETVMTYLHAGGKFDGGAYKVSGGLHGVGAAVVNALSENMWVEVRRGGKLFKQEYARGKAVGGMKTKESTNGSSKATGTTTWFKPDAEIFQETELSFRTLAQRFREMAFLTKGIWLTFVDERDDHSTTYYFEGGIKSFVQRLNKDRKPVNDAFYCEKVFEGAAVEVAIQYNDSFTESTFAFANCIHTIDGGTHLTGFRSALTRVLNEYARKAKILKDNDPNLSGEDTREGLVAVISVKLAEPQFEGQTKTRLGNAEMKGLVESTLSEALSTWLEENPSDARKIIEMASVVPTTRVRDLTDEEINRRDRNKGEDDDFDDDPRRYLAWWAQKRAKELQNPVKRIIDLEKESTVLLMEALETIGDRYGIYGFSGYGRDNVEFYVIKDLGEDFSEHIKRRIDKVVPIRSTRMGPAIRHAITKLDQFDAKVKILFLVSDGRPQDHGYGRDRTEKEYAIHDTKMALNEAKRKGIVPFALTVDRAGHDYLKTMCEDIGYEVVADIESLPSRLPTLYRKLTE